LQHDAADLLRRLRIVEQAGVANCGLPTNRLPASAAAAAADLRRRAGEVARAIEAAELSAELRTAALRVLAAVANAPEEWAWLVTACREHAASATLAESQLRFGFELDDKPIPTDVGPVADAIRLHLAWRDGGHLAPMLRGKPVPLVLLRNPDPADRFLSTVCQSQDQALAALAGSDLSMCKQRPELRSSSHDAWWKSLAELAAWDAELGRLEHKDRADFRNFQGLRGTSDLTWLLLASDLLVGRFPWISPLFSEAPALFSRKRPRARLARTQALRLLSAQPEAEVSAAVAASRDRWSERFAGRLPRDLPSEDASPQLARAWVAALQSARLSHAAPNFLRAAARHARQLAAIAPFVRSERITAALEAST
jgi:hypothetical protein